MKKITAQVILKDKREQEDWAEFLRWEFVEVPPTKDHYGNGIYISATRLNDGLVSVEAMKTNLLGLSCVPNPKNEKIYKTQSERAAIDHYIKIKGWNE